MLKSAGECRVGERRAVLVVGTVAEVDVAFVVVVSAAIVSEKFKYGRVMTGMKLGTSIADAWMDNWKHCLGPSDDTRGS
jgi:hypothetical protein